MGASEPRDPFSQTIDASSLAKTEVSSDGAPATVPDAAPAGGAVPSPASAPSKRSQGEQLPTIGRYVLLRTLGEGGMGVVYAAYDKELDRKVALKLIHPSRQGDSQLRMRILREAQALARVSAPNVVQVYQVGEVDNQLFIAMEFVNGTTLTKWQAEPGRSWQDILRMYLAVGQGVLAAHQADLVHRDFKPDNVLIGKDNRPRVADFGLARIEGQSGPRATGGGVQLSAAALDAPATPAITQAGVVMGTPLYMSPEQHMGEPADSRSDQFSFCVALYEALYHQLPFAGNTIEALAFNTVSGRVRPRPSGSRVPMPVHDALMRGLSCVPGQRFPSMAELLTALSFDPTVDRSAGPRSRRNVTFTLIALSVCAALGLDVLAKFGIGEFAGSLLIALLFCALFVFLSIRFRREIRSNSFHRGTLVYAAVSSGQFVLFRLFGALIGLTYPQLVTIDLTALTITSCMLVLLTMPSLWPLIPLNLMGAFLSARMPAHSANIYSASVALTLIASTYYWNRAVSMRRSESRSRTQSSTSITPIH